MISSKEERIVAKRISSTIETLTYSDVRLKISWVLQSCSFNGFKALTIKDKIETDRAVIGLCSAPGKKLSKGRDGKSHDRNIDEDMSDFKKRGVDCIICLLNKYELRTLGINFDIY